MGSVYPDLVDWSTLRGTRLHDILVIVLGAGDVPRTVSTVHPVAVFPNHPIPCISSPSLSRGAFPLQGMGAFVHPPHSPLEKGPRSPVSSFSRILSSIHADMTSFKFSWAVTSGTFDFR